MDTCNVGTSLTELNLEALFNLPLSTTPQHQIPLPPRIEWRLTPLLPSDPLSSSTIHLLTSDTVSRSNLKRSSFLPRPVSWALTAMSRTRTSMSGRRARGGGKRCVGLSRGGRAAGEGRSGADAGSCSGVTQRRDRKDARP